MLYESYQRKVQKVASFLKGVLKHIVLISVSASVLVLATVALLITKGIITSEGTCYIVSSSYRGEGAANKGARSATFELRIPAEKLSAFTDKVGTLATVLHHNETANDVTMAYIDIESRITVLEAEETALLDIMKGAGTTAELLQIREALTDVQGELASLRAQKKNYDTLVAYSTVHLSVEEVRTERAVSDGSFFSEVGASFVESLGAVGAFFRGVGVFLLGNSPVLLLLAAVAVGVFFAARAVARKKSKKASSESSDENKD